MVDTPAQTNALQHLLDMISGASTQSAATNSAQAGAPTPPSTSTMPVMDPRSWTKAASGNFMPMTIGGQPIGNGASSGGSKGGLGQMMSGGSTGGAASAGSSKGGGTGG